MKAVSILILISCLVLPILSIPLVSAVDDSWTTLTPMPNARSGLGVLVVTRLLFLTAFS